MNPQTLTPQEIHTLQKTGKVTLVRPVEPQPPTLTDECKMVGNRVEFWARGVPCNSGYVGLKSPLGAVGDEFKVYREIELPYGHKRSILAANILSKDVSILTLIYKGTTVEKRDGKWAWLHNVERGHGMTSKQKAIDWESKNAEGS